MVELNVDIINAIKPEFIRLFGIQFKNILRGDIKYFLNCGNIKTISDNIYNIFV